MGRPSARAWVLVLLGAGACGGARRDGAQLTASGEHERRQQGTEGSSETESTPALPVEQEPGEEGTARIPDPAPSASAASPVASGTVPPGIVHRVLRIHLARDAEGAEVFLVRGQERRQVPRLPIAIQFSEADPGYEVVARMPGRTEYRYPVTFQPDEVDKDLYITFRGH